MRFAAAHRIATLRIGKHISSAEPSPCLAAADVKCASHLGHVCTGRVQLAPSNGLNLVRSLTRLKSFSGARGDPKLSNLV
jgi:hypothetical protein